MVQYPKIHILNAEAISKDAVDQIVHVLLLLQFFTLHTKVIRNSPYITRQHCYYFLS